MNLYRQTYSKDGVIKTARKWYCEFYLSNGKRCKLPLYPQKEVSEDVCKRIQELLNHKAGGEVPSEGLQRWVNEQSPAMLNKLAAWGIIERSRVSSAVESLDQHIEDFKTSLKANNFVVQHIQQVISKIKKVFQLCGFKRYTDIKYSTVEAKIADLRRDKVITDDAGNKTIERGLSAKTSNDYIQAVKQFCKWMLKDGRAISNPLTPLEKGETKNDKRHIRRALTAEEAGYLLSWLDSVADERCQLSGPERALMYRLALTTGLRKSELEALTVDCIDFQGKTLTLAGAYTKNRQTATLPLKDDVCEALKTYAAGKLPKAKIFKMPDKTSRVIKLDMEDARKYWIKQAEKNPEEYKRRNESDFLKDITDRGLIDFHSLRHTFGSMLAESGVHPNTAKGLMRHSTIALTMDIYTHSIGESEQKAISNLPEFEKQIMEKKLTGTDDISAVGADDGRAKNKTDAKSLYGSLYFSGGKGRNLAKSGEINQGTEKKQKTASNGSKTGFSAQKGDCVCRDSNPKPSVPKTDALSN